MVNLITRDDFGLKCIEELKISDESVANSLFNKFAGSSDSCINNEFIRQDIKNLRNITQKCVKCANRRIAHLDKNKLHFLPIEIEDIPSLEEINKCVEFLKELLIKYYPLLRFGREIMFSPGDLGEGWKNIFKKPWIN